MRAPPAKPFAVTFFLILFLFIAWAVIGNFLQININEPAHEKIANIVRPTVLILFFIMGFSMVPVMARLFFKMFFGMQKAVGGMNQPAVQKLSQQQETLTAVFVYGVWILMSLGTLIAAPFIFRDMLSGQ
jgi:hypothetical protein